MPFRDLLHTHYNIPVDEQMILNSREGYKYREYLYFTITVENKEIIHMEQAALAYFLMESRYYQMALPVQNSNEEWFTNYRGKSYMVLQVQQLHRDDSLSAGESLAEFHQIGTSYSYEPQEISSYGQWKQLWIDKLTAFETNIEQEAKNNPNNYYRYIMDVLPYIIGISENAIQYIQESERDSRFHESDRGTIAFKRYDNHLAESILWGDELVYDHPSRDLAEYIRTLLLTNADQKQLITFLKDYQSIRPLSIFSWRLLYARLIFPVPIFDLIEGGFLTDDYEQLYTKTLDLFAKQSDYEEKLRGFFEVADVDAEALHIPMLHWL